MPTVGVRFSQVTSQAKPTGQYARQPSFRSEPQLMAHAAPGWQVQMEGLASLQDAGELASEGLTSMALSPAASPRPFGPASVTQAPPSAGEPASRNAVHAPGTSIVAHSPH